MNSSEFPAVFARLVAEAVPGMLKHQRANGAIIYNEKAPIVYPQQAIYPLAFCFAGKDPEQRHKGSPEIAKAIAKLSTFLIESFDDTGHFQYDSYGYSVKTVDQRLTFAWVEALRLLRESGANFDYDRWGSKIERACETLIEHRLRKLEGVRRFIGRVLGTGANHVALYFSTIYRAGEVLDRPKLIEYVLPIARAMAADVHPDGYWEEHSDLLRNGGPTPSYNYLTQAAFALLYAWTGEGVFRAAIERSTRLHANFTYPDAHFFDLIDERVRSGHDDSPRVWGLFGFSHSPEGRGSAIAHYKGWRAMVGDVELISPELLARHCENYSYWSPGEVVAAPFEQPEHTARLIMPAGIFRRKAWCVGLSAIRATTAEDAAYADNPFSLDRQKLFSVWHEKTGTLIDGSHSKLQKENSTFAGPANFPNDFLPCGGSVGEENTELVARAAYKTFYGEVRIRPLSSTTLQIDLSVDPAGCQGPYTAAFTMPCKAKSITGLNGKEVKLGETPFAIAAAELGGGFRFGLATVKGADFTVNWPMGPYNSYTSDHKCWPGQELLRVSAELTPARQSTSITVSVEG
jgi:hypothetical protein